MNGAELQQIVSALLDSQQGAGQGQLPRNPWQVDMMRPGPAGAQLIPNPGIPGPKKTWNWPQFVPPKYRWPEIPVQDYRNQPL